jgi:DHA2 family multidrug resistance protein-like MFS transporter
VALAAGLVLLAALPAHASTADIVWRMVVCGAGFGLFQTPNNSAMIGASPAARSGAAGGMLATARLLGQTGGAALVAVIFGLSPRHGTTLTLAVAAICAGAAACVSVLRLRAPNAAAAE